MQSSPASSNRRIVVIGATGRTGRHLVRKLLLERKEPCRIAVRNVPKAKSVLQVPEESACTFVQADLMDKESIAKAIEGANVVLYAAGSQNTFWSNPNDSAKRIDYEGFMILVDACKASVSRPHLIVCSSALVTYTWHPIALLINGISGGALYWKYYGEEYLRNSGVQYTIVRPGGLTDTEGGKTALSVGQGDQLRGRIPRADVAETMLQCMNRSTTLSGVTFEVVSSSSSAPDARFPWAESDWNALFAPLKADPKN